MACVFGSQLNPHDMASFPESGGKAIANRDKADSTFSYPLLSNTSVLVQNPTKEMMQNMMTLDPFRKVPADVLSLVFIEASLMNWRAPLQLGAVCSRWRDALLCTPRAWACLKITPSSQITNHQLLDLWFSRCGALKVHISLYVRASRAVIDIVCRHERNIQCLSLFKNSNILQSSFTQLEELRLGHSSDFGWPLQARSFPDANELQDKDVLVSNCCILDVERFPKLATLHLHGPSAVTMAAIARQSSFPPLQELHVMIFARHWSQIIEYCAETLVTLAIELPHDFSSATALGNEAQSSITLPRLQRLFYVNQFRGPSEFVPRLPFFKTPALHTYHETNGHEMSPFHQDVSSVTSIFLQQVKAINWAQFPSLTHLQILDNPADIKQKLVQLEIDAQLCTKLASVDCVPLFMTPGWETAVRLSLQKRSNATGKSIALDTNANRRAAYSRCFTFCNCDAGGGIQDDVYWEKSIQPAFLDEEDESEPSYDEEYDEEYDRYGYGEYEECPGCGGACLH